MKVLGLAYGIHGAVPLSIQAVSEAPSSRRVSVLALLFGSCFMMIWLFATAGTMATYGHYVPGGLNGTAAVSWVINSDATSAKGAVIACTYLLVATYSFTWAPISGKSVSNSQAVLETNSPLLQYVLANLVIIYRGC